MTGRILASTAAFGLAFLLVFMPIRAQSISSSAWELHQTHNASSPMSKAFAVVQNKNNFVVLSVGWNEDKQEYIIGLHSQHLIDRSKDIRFNIDNRDSITFKGSRNWTQREFSISNRGKSAIIGSPYSQDAKSLRQRKRTLIEWLQSGRRAVVRYDEIVYGSRTVRFTLKDSRDTISSLTGKASKE